MVVTDLTVIAYAGNPRQVNHTVLDQDTNGSPPKPLTGIDARWVVSRIDGNGNPNKISVLVKDSQVASGITFPDAVNGRLRVHLLAADTLLLAPAQGSQDYYFELELYDVLGANTTLPLVVATGTLTIRRNVT